MQFLFSLIPIERKDKGLFFDKRNFKGFFGDLDFDCGRNHRNGAYFWYLGVARHKRHDQEKS